MTDLVELDSVEILAIVDNELDPISPCANAAIKQSGGVKEISMHGYSVPSDERGGSTHEFRMDNICCGAYGLSLMVTGWKDGCRHTVLFDTGPEGAVWERNARRLRADIGKVEFIHLSHWHRDHSGGMLKALKMINTARTEDEYTLPPIHVDLHPNRPDYRGLKPPGLPVISLEADPTFEEITKSNSIVEKHDEPHLLLENMFLVSGEIPRVTGYEKGMKFGVRFNAQSGEWITDEEMRDERLLMCKLKDKGIVVISGCSHAGIVNASKHAIELAGDVPLYAIVGGFHLADAPPSLIQDTVGDLKKLDPRVLIAGHCTGWRAKFELYSQMPGRFTPCFVGSKFVL